MALETADLNFKSRDFVHLHLHTDYSLLQSAIQLKPLAKRLGELEMRACAITDYGNMYGAVSFYKTMKEAKVRPIIGYEAFVTSGSRVGSPAMPTRGCGAGEARQVANFIADALEHPHDEGQLERVKKDVMALCARFPVYGPAMRKSYGLS